MSKKGKKGGKKGGMLRKITSSFLYYLINLKINNNILVFLPF